MAAVLGSDPLSARPVRGGDVCSAYRVELANGRAVFAKTRTPSIPGFFAVEAAGLRWLGAPSAGVPTPSVLAATDDLLVLEWVEPGTATQAAAESLGRRLAATHRAGAPRFGAERDGWIGPLPQSNRPGNDWPAFYAEHRVLPFLRRGVDAGAIAPADRGAVEAVLRHLPELAGPAEPPARIHGDLWSGNVLWSADGDPRLVDPAAHGGHRETDLAMLALFGAPYLSRILAAYQEAFPLAERWPVRVPLHQIHPLLVHAVLFGGGYGAAAGDAARRALALTS